MFIISLPFSIFENSPLRRWIWTEIVYRLQVAGVPGVTEALFRAWEAALSAGTTPTLYTCSLCEKEYTSSRAHEQHLTSRSHLMRAAASQDPTTSSSTAGGITTPLPVRATAEEDGDAEESAAAGESTSSSMQVNAADCSSTTTRRDDEIEEELELELELDPSCCFMCDLEHGTVDDCLVHLHKKHGFFVPDSEYLKDPDGLLTYVGLKVR